MRVFFLPSPLYFAFRLQYLSMLKMPLAELFVFCLPLLYVRVCIRAIFCLYPAFPVGLQKRVEHQLPAAFATPALISELRAQCTESHWFLSILAGARLLFLGLRYALLVLYSLFFRLKNIQDFYKKKKQEFDNSCFFIYLDSNLSTLESFTQRANSSAAVIRSEIGGYDGAIRMLLSCGSFPYG